MEFPGSNPTANEYMSNIVVAYGGECEFDEDGISCSVMPDTTKVDHEQVIEESIITAFLQSIDTDQDADDFWSEYINETIGGKWYKERGIIEGMAHNLATPIVETGEVIAEQAGKLISAVTPKIPTWVKVTGAIFLLGAGGAVIYKIAS